MLRLKQKKIPKIRLWLLPIIAVAALLLLLGGVFVLAPAPDVYADHDASIAEEGAEPHETGDELAAISLPPQLSSIMFVVLSVLGALVIIMRPRRESRTQEEERNAR